MRPKQLTDVIQHRADKYNCLIGSPMIKDVWIGNFFDELNSLSSLIVKDYNILSFVRIIH